MALHHVHLLLGHLQDGPGPDHQVVLDLGRVEGGDLTGVDLTIVNQSVDTT